jgi:predicted dehydrogenase
MQIEIAVIGAGYWGPNLIRNFASLPDCRLKLVCDKDEKARSTIAAKFSVNTTASLSDILDDEDIRAVAIATPASTHFAIARECLLRGKHVLVEKPFVLDIGQGEELLALAEQRGLVLMVDHIFLFSPAVRKLAGIIASGRLGQIRYIRSVRTSLGPRVCEDTNIVYDAQIHDVYLIQHLLQLPALTASASGSAFLRKGIEDVVFTTLSFAGGTVANCHNTSYAPVKERRMVIVGDRAMCIYDDMKSEAPLEIYDCGFEPADGVDALGNRGLRLFDRGKKVEPTEKAEPLRVECGHFIECVRNGMAPLSGGRDALDVMRTLGAIDAALKSGTRSVIEAACCVASH